MSVNISPFFLYISFRCPFILIGIYWIHFHYQWHVSDIRYFLSDANAFCALSTFPHEKTDDFQFERISNSASAGPRF